MTIIWISTKQFSSHTSHKIVYQLTPKDLMATEFVVQYT